jgi:hypothetical protein
MGRPMTPMMTNLLPSAVGVDGRVNLFVGNVRSRKAQLKLVALPSEMARPQRPFPESWHSSQGGCELGPGQPEQRVRDGLDGK